MLTPETIQDTVAALFAAIQGLDVEAWLACFAPDAENRDPADAPPQAGHAAIRAGLEAAVNTFAAISITADNVFSAGNQAAVKWTAQFEAKNGKSAHCEGVDVIDFNAEGKIQVLRAFWDPAAMMAQLAD